MRCGSNSHVSSVHDLYGAAALAFGGLAFMALAQAGRADTGHTVFNLILNGLLQPS